MIDWTDRYCRFFHRQVSHHARLYTEMVVDQAILRGDAEQLLAFDGKEHPVALQLGGSDPETLAEAARVGASFGYDEINLNVGCPSDRVQSGRFGACLMQEPDLVARAVAAMAGAVSVPVTVKCRIGVDDQEPEQILPQFLSRVTDAGAGTVIIHARKAWLDGLSPKENRTIPPLDHELVARMKERFPSTRIILNGGITTLGATKEWLGRVDGVMLGRAAYENPYLLAGVDEQLFGDVAQPRGRAEIVTAVAEHFDREGVPLWRYARHMLGLFHGEPGARRWRQRISADARAPERSGQWLIDLAVEIAAYRDQPVGAQS